MLRISVSPCVPNPCQHGGKCEVLDQGGYRCICADGYGGQTCTGKILILLNVPDSGLV